MVRRFKNCMQFILTSKNIYVAYVSINKTVKLIFFMRRLTNNLKLTTWKNVLDKKWFKCDWNFGINK